MPPSDSSGSASGRPKRRWVGTTQVVVVVALVLLALVYARVPDGNGDAEFRIGAAESPKPLVNVFHPVAGDNTLVVTATGSVDVRNHVALTPQVTGRVVSISPSLRVGGTFRGGGATAGHRPPRLPTGRRRRPGRRRHGGVGSTPGTGEERRRAGQLRPSPSG